MTDSALSQRRIGVDLDLGEPITVTARTRRPHDPGDLEGDRGGGAFPEVVRRLGAFLVLLPESSTG